MTIPTQNPLPPWGPSRPAQRPIQGIKYTLKHWDGLNRFLNNGRIEIDSNTVERAIRP